MTAHVYAKASKTLADKLAQLETDNLKCMLLSAYTPAQDTHQFVSDVKAAGTELSATGYTAGGVALSGVTFTQSGHVYTLSFTNPNWANLSGSPAFAVIYDSSPGSDATNPVLAYADFGGASSPGGQSFTLQYGSGAITFTVS